MSSGDTSDTRSPGRSAPEEEVAVLPAVEAVAAAPRPVAPTPAGPGYRVWPFVRGFLETAAGRVPRIEPRLSWEDVVGRWRARWGIGRPDYRVAPGLYAVGSPWETSPVLVTANYKLTFDSLRSSLADVDAWILVVDTRGMNVWCAAGVGGFDAGRVSELVHASGVARVVSHRMLVLPQLAAPGVAAHEVGAACGFAVVYGPVRASDLKAFLAAGNVATREMRRITFSWRERLILTPVELVNKIAPSKWILPGLLVAGGLGPGLFSPRGAVVRGIGAILAYLTGVVAGSVLTPILLPWLPGRMFSYKGALVGLVAAFLGVVRFWSVLGWADRIALFPAVAVTSSYCAMLFAGSTTFTSPSGVEKEMRKALKYQMGGLLAAALIWIGSRF